MFSLFLEGTSREWYLDSLEGSPNNWHHFHEAFNKVLSTIKEGMQLLAKLHGDEKTKNERVKKFIEQFDKFL